MVHTSFDDLASKSDGRVIFCPIQKGTKDEKENIVKPKTMVCRAVVSVSRSKAPFRRGDALHHCLSNLPFPHCTPALEYAGPQGPRAAGLLCGSQ